mmetsp:Transcript_16891/g.31489  ORF Transcript_16891/g.31489 Transcript_16891/m.31489 type:complete len:504 (+) Transcript_16891:88-1599(+)
MCMKTLVLASMACAGRGLREQSTRQEINSSVLFDERQDSKVSDRMSSSSSFPGFGKSQSKGQLKEFGSLNAMAILLLTLTPAAAFNHCSGRSFFPAKRSIISGPHSMQFLSPRMPLPRVDVFPECRMCENGIVPAEQRIEPSLNNTWYAVGYSEQLQDDKLFATRLFGEPLVLYRDSEGNAVCVRDVCPHRAAPFSMGDVKDGVLRCFYHGWGFGENGKCVSVPTMPGTKRKPNLSKICAKACAVVEKDELLWVWRGNVLTADITKLPSPLPIERELAINTVLDYDVDWPYLVENSLEVSHLSELSMQESTLAVLLALKSGEAGVACKHIAPNIVRHSGDTGFMEEVHVVPIAPKRTRVLLRQRLAKGPLLSVLLQLPGTLPLLRYLVRQTNYRASQKAYSAMQTGLSEFIDDSAPSEKRTPTGNELIDKFWVWLREAAKLEGSPYFKRWGTPDMPLAYAATGWQADDAVVGDNGKIVGTYGLKKSYVRDHPLPEYEPMRKLT